MAKVFKTINEQISILQSKGLVIRDTNEASEILLRENYFFISGYRKLFMESSANKQFLNGTTFDELYAMFQFDRHIRNILFKNLLIIENNTKSITSYCISSKYGIKEDDYLNAKNFVSDRKRRKQVEDLIRKMKRQIRINGGQHEATTHYINKYGFIPLWIAVKVLSFGIVSELFQILKTEDQENIAKHFGVSKEDLSIFLPILSNFRNLCAHEDILYDHKTNRTIRSNIYHEKLNIPRMDNEYIYGKNDIFVVVIIMKFLLQDDEFRLMMKEIEYEINSLDARINSIPVEKILDRIGFPQNYMELIDL